MADGHTSGNIIQGQSVQVKKFKRCLGVKGKVEKNTLLKYDAKTEAKIIIFQRKQTVKNVHDTSNAVVNWTNG
jgi:hypothetical protein